MKALSLGLWLAAFALPLGCSGDDDSAPMSSGGSGGQASNATAGKAGSSNGGTSGNGAAGQSNAGQNEGGSDTNATTRDELCATICATQAALPCAPETAECVSEWCDAQVKFSIQANCLEPYDTMLRCMAKEPIESFECSEGTPEPKPDVCAAEVATLNACLLAE
jgi:hypothetical protein